MGLGSRGPTGTADRSPEDVRVWGRLGVLVGAALLVLIQLYVSIPLVPVVEPEFGDGAAAALGSAYSLAYALGFLVFGPLSDRRGRKAVLVPGMAALAVSTAVVAAADSVPVLAALRALQGLAASSFAAVALAYAGEAMPPRWRSPAVGAISTAFLVAGIVGQVYAQVVAEALGWRWVFLLGAPVLAAVCVVMLLVLTEPDREPVRTGLVRRYVGLFALATRRELGLLYLALATVLLSFVAMYSALGPLLETRFGLDHGELLLVRLAGLPGMLLAPVAGVLATRYGASLVTQAGFGVAAAGLAAEAAASSHLASLVVASGIFVAGIALVVPGSLALVGGRAGAMRAGALGVGGLAIFVGASAGPLLAELGIGFRTFMLALAALALCGGALVALSGQDQRPAAG